MDSSLIITGGSSPPVEVLQFLGTRFRICVAADSGADTALAAGIRPDYFLGDMDSVSSEHLEQITGWDISVSEFDKDKDYSDSELALRKAKTLWAPGEFIAMAGGGGGRIDHLMANIRLFDTDIYPDYWITADSEVFPLVSDQELNIPRGSTVSILPVGRGPWKMESTGLKWNLNDIRWSPGQISLSNSTIFSTIQLSVLEGRFLFIRPLPQEEYWVKDAADFLLLDQCIHIWRSNGRTHS
ncbi:thiamine diphosphokinase [Salinispira pacifica]|uniref:Thiamine diphosphokinase n=1 Tax=Salinispira pacifica TaxID=1307761 RepID=V5WHW8_9SPIO|nr:thiamine diphosphokinase [Salinispira pacifica]AHC15134.1 Thiamin pyrophosphokinase [Salinispira pacifica]